ncbi:hypothetical protein [Streptomyces roseifaciens]|uniref:hypothetical protein n=1 Tax=Streptomyces roseifaciens TaxID=1488406 RepID=UPI000717ED1D|nr:hypothetical protein [Streptomyces roseifaciens]
MNAAQHTPARSARRRTTRLAAAAALLLLPATALGALAVPAQAASSCTVNGVPQPGPVINGTPGNDTVICSFLDTGHVINALAGNDTITFSGDIRGRLNAGDDADAITTNRGSHLFPEGDLDGQFGRDRITISGTVEGKVRGGQDSDQIDLENATTAQSTLVRGARGDDRITFRSGVVNKGSVEGFDGNDVIVVPDNQGVVDGGAGVDICHVGGNPPLNCEVRRR